MPAATREALQALSLAALVERADTEGVDLGDAEDKCAIIDLMLGASIAVVDVRAGKMQALRDELKVLPLVALVRRAKTEGVDAKQLDGAECKAAFIELIVAKQMQPAQVGTAMNEQAHFQPRASNCLHRARTHALILRHLTINFNSVAQCY